MGTTNNQFSMELPEDWQDQTAYTFMGPEEGGVKHMLTLTIDRKLESDDLKAFARQRIDTVKATLQGLEILKEEERTLANGTPVYEMACRWIPVDGRILVQRHYYMIIDGAGYTFSGTFTKQTVKTIGVEVERAINSFKPLPASSA